MHSVFKHLLIWFLISNLMVSTMGFTVHSIICLCKGEQEFSFFQINDTCEKTNPGAIKDSKCCKQTACHPANSESKPHNCSKKDQKFVKLKVDGVSPTIESGKVLSVFVVLGIPATMFRAMLSLAPLLENDNKAPPHQRPFGAFLRMLLHSFLC